MYTNFLIYITRTV